MIMQDKKGKKLFEGTRQECIRFANTHGIQPREYILCSSPEEPYETTSIEQKPKGFFKRIFKT